MKKWLTPLKGERVKRVKRWLPPLKGEKVKRWLTPLKGERVKGCKGEKMATPINLQTN